ncbi:SusC/RagA family TonB-linked outer membrane protein [Chitinophaga sp. G-6-1-13]|uniref:SusC/RagA family TonB-linked outer membrane protein n=1 Tax=Chitinophaga fulva TaxID=2728842 RepID=A0A848GSY5_9BACT|nr:SusC/RagA family TonB-linked outer membrane protein [Chitinophaga fulva]NML41157.1 SusC/RagA family TonB-linked outer membrane protein [Chitinophaga fulva]
MQSTKRCLLLFMLFCIGSMFAYGQGKMTVSGTIKDATGNVLEGATVSEKGTSNWVPTGKGGSFTINVKPDARLVVSYVGFVTQELPATSSMQITLVPNVRTTEEVVVTALGIKKQAKALGYAVSKIDNERIMASGTPSNPLQALYGAAPGVQVGATAAGPTAGMKINIRNAVSFDQNSTTRPLIVVDGVPIHDQNTQMGYGATDRDNGTGINDINPDDIASMEILKGAKASVLYGSEGANGVLLITTKSGAKGKGLGVSASFTTSWDRAAFLPKLQNEYGTGSSPSNSRNDAQGYYLDANGKRALATTLGDGFGAAAFGPKFDPSVKLLWWDGVERPWVAQTKNIYNDLYQTGHQNTTNVALSGGNDQGQIRFSYTNSNMTPIRPGSRFDKNTFSLNSSYKLNNNITLKYTGNFFISKNLNAANLNTMNGEGQQSEIGAFSADINVGLLKSHLLTPDGYNYFANPSLRNLISNGRKGVVGFLWDQLENQSIFTRLHNIQSLSADIKLTNIFSATLMGGLDYSTERNEYKGKLLDPQLIGPNSGFMYSDVTNTYKTTYGQGMLNFDTKINSDFDLSGFVGGVIRKNYTEGKGASVNGYGQLVIPNYFSFNNLPLGIQPQYQFTNGQDLLYSLIGSAQLAWRNQVYIEAQGRQDWSSILPPGYNHYFYPGISAAWILSESFKLPAVFEYAKVRGSFATVGRPGPRYFSNVNYTTSQTGGGYVLTPPSDLPPMDANGKPNLKPERKREFELGFETYLLPNKRIGVDFSYYRSHIYDQIMAVAAPPGMGVKNVRMNAGDVMSTGWELAIKTKPVVSKNFEWDVNLTFARGKTVVEKLDGKLQSLTLWNSFGAVNTVANVGQEYGQIYLTKSTYTYNNPNDANDPSNGKRVVNAAGSAYDYTSTAKLIGKTIPDVTGGFFTSFAYKNIRLIANIDYQFGATFLSGSETYMMAAGALNETLKYRDEAHGGAAYYLDASSKKVAGTNPNGGPTFHDGVILDGVGTDGKPNTKVVSADNYYYDSYFSNGFFPEDRIFKSDYVALRNVAIDYTLSPRIAHKVRMSNLVVSVFANNVGYLYKAAPNSIPESTNGTGWGVGSYGTTALPAQRSIGISIKTKF